MLGRHGQVARELAGFPLPVGWSLTTAGREEIDLTDLAGARAAILDRAPDAVINAAAYTAVDRAESEPDAAARLNAEAPAAVAAACAQLGATLVHLSTDYVFDGRKLAPYVETDPVSPLGVYGRTKSEGETAVRESGATAAILRTSWVFSAHGANFVKTMLRLADEREEVAVVDDQVGRPTWARDVAAACLLAVAGLRDRLWTNETFHVSGDDDATWADVADHVFQRLAQAGRPAPRLRRIATRDYPAAAARPANSRLDNARARDQLFFTPRPWRDGVDLALLELGVR